MSKKLRDVQNEPDFRSINIDKVGVKDIRYPIVVLDKKNKIQHTVASVGMFVDLPHNYKGTHMSRFIEILNEHRGEITVKNFPEILKKMKRRFSARVAHLDVEFPYFIEKAAPRSKAKGLMEYGCRLSGALGEKLYFVLAVTVPIMTLCPCSKEISRRGAHNQRGVVKASLRFKGFVWIEDIIKVIEGSSSSPVFSILKRIDEKHVTESAYDKPMFVEDVVREVSMGFKRLKGITWAKVEAENFESIHNHSAYACLEMSYKR